MKTPFIDPKKCTSLNHSFEYSSRTSFSRRPWAPVLARSDPAKTFFAVAQFDPRAHARRHDLALSLDVIYHLVEDEVFSEYLQRLFVF